MSDYIHGSTDPREVARLIKQAAFVAPWSLRDFPIFPGHRVLDLATGVGAMAQELSNRFPGTNLFAAELRMSQIRSARAHCPRATYVQANGTALPFADASFDRVHCSWLLEHVPSAPGPVAVLKEVRRVLRPGGMCQFLEVENASLAMHPPSEVVRSTWAAMNEAQLRGGGDPYIGPKLERYFKEAGFTRVDVRPLPLRGDASNQEFFSAFAIEFAEIFESLDESLPERASDLHACAQALRDLVQRADGWISYTPYVAQASP